VEPKYFIGVDHGAGRDAVVVQYVDYHGNPSRFVKPLVYRYEEAKPGVTDLVTELRNADRYVRTDRGRQAGDVAFVRGRPVGVALEATRDDGYTWVRVQGYATVSVEA